MKILTTKGFPDYELLDSGNGKRLERYGKYRISRPDPQCIWTPNLTTHEWQKADAEFVQDGKKGNWVTKTEIPGKWLISYKNLAFYARLTPFKHTGIFPEQHLQWDFIREKVTAGNNANVLNLFAYTGIASLAASEGGAKVTHVDASKPSISWARQNQEASKLSDKPIRWILDDAIKFVGREARRGVKYDGIIMDPPIYGHGPGGEVWDFHQSFPELMALCKQVLSDKPSFLIINAYAISASAIMLENVLKEYVQDLGGQIESGELALEEKGSGRLLSTGIFTRWSKS